MFKDFTHKLFHRKVILFWLVIALVYSYGYFLREVKKDSYQLFNVKKGITWAKTSKSIYRTQTQGIIDNYLLSEDPWHHFDLKVQVINPYDCGMLFAQEDFNNYRFIYLNKRSNSAVIGQIQNGQLIASKTFPMNFGSLALIAIARVEDKIKTTVNGKLLSEESGNIPDGRLGLMINEMANPPTVFYNINVKGTLSNGQKMAYQISANNDDNDSVAKTFWDFIPFYGVLMAVLIFLSLSDFKFLTLNISFAPIIKKTAPFIVHFILAVCVFWPFFSRGNVAIFSYDNLGEIMPLFFYAKHNFINILQGNAPWLWNPFIQNGFPFYSNHWDMIYYPLNWPIFLVSDENFLAATTFKTFLEVFLIGVFAYGFFRREFQNPRWALLSSVSYQLCSLLIFTLSIFPTTSLFFSMTFYLYLLWSAPQRKTRVNIIWISFSVFLVLTSANVAFIFYACLSLGVISIYRFMTVENGPRLFWITFSGWVLGVLMSSVRIFSCLQGVMSGNRMLENFNTIHDRAYMILRLFVPEIAGWMGPDALDVLKSPNLRLIFRELELPSSNPQNSFFIYFGILPALLLMASLFIPLKGKHAFWRTYTLVAIGCALLWQPLWGILSILSFPLAHYSYHSIVIPVGICSLIGFTGMAWESRAGADNEFQNKLNISLWFLAAYVLVFLTYLFPALAPISRIIMLIFTAGIVLGYILNRNYKIACISFMSIATMILNGVAFIVLLSLSYVYTLSPIPKKESLGAFFILPFLWFAGGCVLFIAYETKRHKVVQKILIPMGIGLVGAGILVYSGWIGHFLNWEPGVRVYVQDTAAGILKLYFLLQIGLLGFAGLTKKTFSPKIIFLVFLILTCGDLLVFNARFNNITAPFYYKNSFYPAGFTYRDLSPELKKTLDLTNFRTNHMDRVGFNANKNLVFGIPSYTGTVGYMTPRFSKLLTSFGYVEGIYMLYPEDSTENARFLDLSAVRYSFNHNGTFEERQPALGRLNIFYSVKHLPDDEQTLAMLLDRSFDLHKSILLSAPLAGLSDDVDLKSEIIPIDQNLPGRLEASVDLSRPGILLFVESFDRGWKAVIDGQPARIERANYNFMACAVNQGKHRVELIYDPPEYRRNLILSMIGLVLFGVLAGSALIKKFGSRQFH